MDDEIRVLRVQGARTAWGDADTGWQYVGVSIQDGDEGDLDRVDRSVGLDADGQGIRPLSGASDSDEEDCDCPGEDSGDVETAQNSSL